MKYIGQFFQDDNEHFSATRLAFLAWAFGALIVWSAGSLHDQKMQEVPSSIQVLIGILMTGKVAQKFGEESGSPPTTDQRVIENGKPSSPFPSGNSAALASGKTTEPR